MHRHMVTVVTLLAAVMAANIIKPVDHTFHDVPSHIRSSY